MKPRPMPAYIVTSRASIEPLPCKCGCGRIVKPQPGIPIEYFSQTCRIRASKERQKQAKLRKKKGNH